MTDQQPTGWDATGKPIYAQAAAPVTKTPTGWDATGQPIYEDAKAAQGSTRPQEGANVDKPVGFWENLGAGLNPMPLIKALSDDSSHPAESAILKGAGAPPGLGNVIRGIVGAQVGEWQKAKEAYDSGHYGNALMYAISGAAPIAGPMATNFGETVQRGDYAGAAGQVAAIAGPAALGKVKIPALKTGGLKNPNPQEALALQFAREKGVPMDAGAVTGSPVVRGAQYLADRTLAAAPSVNRAAEAQTTGLRATLGELANKAGPVQTPESAGAAVQAAVSRKIGDLHAEASAGYDKLRQLEAANTRSVQVGTTPSPSGLVKDAVPVMEDMAFPVDVRPVKAVLKPLYDRIRRQMPIAQQQASEGLKAIENIVHGQDFAPATVLDKDLSAIKRVARGADRPELRDVSQGLAAKAVSQLDAAVKGAIAQGGPEATAALAQGRTATRAKYLAAEIDEALQKEPVRAYRQGTTPKDAAIGQLRELQTIAPTELPKIGRAFLEDLTQTAMKDGGFDKTGTIAEKWANLGPQTKKLLFADQQLVTQLDRFFLAAKRLKESANPSQSGGMVQIGSQMGLAIYNPALGAVQQVTGALLSKAMRNKKFIKLLTDGMTIRPGTMTAKAWLGSIAPFFNEGTQQ